VVFPLIPRDEKLGIYFRHPEGERRGRCVVYDTTQAQAQSAKNKIVLRTPYYRGVER
jgi:hypothetical protein